MKKADRLEARDRTGPQIKGKLGCLRRLGTIRSAAALAFAVVLAWVLATSLSLTVVLALAGVLWQRIVLSEHDAGVSGLDAGAIRLGRLSIQTDGSATDQTCKRGGQSERLYRVLH